MLEELWFRKYMIIREKGGLIKVVESEGLVKRCKCREEGLKESVFRLC